ncbi:MAG TPA: hypothetical protein VF593_04795 [Chthoniobacteraceae bacterium]|jgi:hypothetical protein
MTSSHHFFPILRRFQLRWRAGLLLVGVLRAILWAGVALLLFGLLDFSAGFSDGARRWVAGAIALAAGLGLARGLWDAIFFRTREAAAAADGTLGSTRREVLSAFELNGSSRAETQDDGFAGWLRERAVQNAARQLHQLRFSQSLPRRQIRRGSWPVLALAAALGVCALLAPKASRIIAARLLHPGADLPPYSSIEFQLGPRPAQVLYGGEVIVTASLTGGKIDRPVRCLTRDPATGRIDDSPAFHESASRFSRKLEKVASPVEIAFAVGRARSAWLPVSVLMQPRVQEVLITVEPPAYSGLPRREFALGTQELAALSGSRVTARATSNRPLTGGALRLETAGIQTIARELPGQPEETHRVRFEWVVRQASRVVIQVHDVLGTRSEPLTFEQKLTPDRRPEVALRQPAGEVLATPDSELPLEASASDDLGLTRVALVRQLRGYRERSLPQAAVPGERRHELAGKLNLAAFGLLPGQVVELTLEAGDTNPNLLGVSTSEPARVHIIDRERYAELLRSQTTLEDFSGRYEALREAMDAARKSLEALEKAATAGDAAAAEAAREAALEAHRAAGKLFGQIAKDFPIFDLDASLASASAEAMQQLFENAQQLEKLAQALPEHLREALPELRERLGRGEEAVAEEQQQGERAVAAAEVLEQAGRFRETIQAQRDLVKEFNRTLEQIRRGETKAGQALRELSRTQAAVASGLREIETGLDTALKALPEDLARLAEEGRKFLQALAELEITPTMDQAAAAAEAGDGKTAGERAGEALAKLEALLRRKNAVCEMCRGEAGDLPFPWPEDLSQTLEQLMRALVTKRGQDGEGELGSGGSGSGAAGSSESGFSMRGKMPKLPIFGPSRQRFARRAGPQLGGGAEGRGQSGPESGAAVDSAQTAAREQRSGAGEAVAAEAVPEGYREAVKRYFSPDEKPGGAAAIPPKNPQP